MRSATRYALAAFAFVLWSGSAAAQNNVTFQVNLQPFITSCQFDPAVDRVLVRGNFNGFSEANALTAAGNGLYRGTVSIAAGPIDYKFYTTNSSVLGWEDNATDGGASADNRDYTVTAGAQTVPTTTFNKTVSNACGRVQRTYDVLFSVDMSNQIRRGVFNPRTQRVAVAGSFAGAAGANGLSMEGWDGTNSIPLQENPLNPGVFEGFAENRGLLTPTGQGDKFKFVIVDNTTNEIRVYDSPRSAVTATQGGNNGGDRLLVLRGTETSTDADPELEYTYDNDNNPATPVFFSDGDASQFLAAAATVTFNVDIRSARSRLAASGALPPGEGSTPSTGVTAINSLFLNGPAAGESRQDLGPAGGIGDWAGWGAPLAAATTRQLSGPDANGIYTITLNYDAGATSTLVGKLGVNGADNEAGFGGDHRFPIRAGAQTFNLAFGCVRQENGRFVDQTGAMGAFNAYDEYLLIRNDLATPTCTTVTSGGVAGDINQPVAIEDGAQISGLEIGAAYPNPVRGSGRIELTLERAMTVSARVYDVTGRQVATLLDGQQVGAGTTTVEIGTSRLAVGVYVLRIEADGQVASRRMTVTR